jgi:hypothetical protein
VKGSGNKMKKGIEGERTDKGMKLKGRGEGIDRTRKWKIREK